MSTREELKKVEERVRSLSAQRRWLKRTNDLENKLGHLAYEFSCEQSHSAALAAENAALVAANKKQAADLKAAESTILGLSDQIDLRDQTIASLERQLEMQGENQKRLVENLEVLQSQVRELAADNGRLETDLANKASDASATPTIESSPVEETAEVSEADDELPEHVLAELHKALDADPTQYVPAADSEAEIIAVGDSEMEKAVAVQASPSNGMSQKKFFGLFGGKKKLPVLGSSRAWGDRPETLEVPRAELRGTEEEPILQGSILG